MIAKLTGLIAEIGSDWLIVDVAGVGYLVSCSARTLGGLQTGAAASLHIETQMREDRIQLFGFLSPTERGWFRLLQSVQGVGGRVALAILSVLTPGELDLVIASGDRVRLSRADGVGPKLATRILSELKDKAGGLVLASGPTAPAAGTHAADSGAQRDAVSALVNLGYGRSEAFGAISAVSRRLGETATLDSLIKNGLKELTA